MPLWQPANAIARPAYYDRDAIPISMQYNQIIAPAASTVRATYSPPFGYAAFIEVSTMLILRFTAAAPASQANDQLRLNPFYGGVVIVAINLLNSNVIGDQRQAVITSYGYMAYGDVMDAVTFDGSVGGTMQHGVFMKGTEFLY